MANSKGRFNIWVAPVALTFDRFFDWDFHISISATQGHTRVPEQVSEISLGERLSIERCRKLGMIFHATDNANYESIREQGLVLEATRASWQKHRLAVHFRLRWWCNVTGTGDSRQIWAVCLLLQSRLRELPQSRPRAVSYRQWRGFGI